MLCVVLLRGSLVHFVVVCAVVIKESEVHCIVLL